MEVIVEQTDLPNARFAEAWSSIKLPENVRERLEAQALLAITLRQKYSFEMMPVHGLIVLAGPPGTGKTTLARGLANKVSGALKAHKPRFIQIDPHALTSSALGRSQQQVTKLFHQTIPEFAAGAPCMVLLDEVETLAPDRQRMSLEANPVDVHRATDAALAGLDLLTRKHRNILLIATTNYPDAVDRALLSRADWIEDVGLPNAEARSEIISETLDQLAQQWPRVGDLKRSLGSFVAASEGLDGRRIRKTIISAAASTTETARDLNNLKADHVLTTLKAVAKARPAGKAA